MKKFNKPMYFGVIFLFLIVGANGMQKSEIVERPKKRTRIEREDLKKSEKARQRPIYIGLKSDLLEPTFFYDKATCVDMLISLADSFLSGKLRVDDAGTASFYHFVENSYHYKIPFTRVSHLIIEGLRNSIIEEPSLEDSESFVSEFITIVRPEPLYLQDRINVLKQSYTQESILNLQFLRMRLFAEKKILFPQDCITIDEKTGVYVVGRAASGPLSKIFVQLVAGLKKSSVTDTQLALEKYRTALAQEQADSLCIQGVLEEYRDRAQMNFILTPDMLCLCWLYAMYYTNDHMLAGSAARATD